MSRGNCRVNALVITVCRKFTRNFSKFVNDVFFRLFCCFAFFDQSPKMNSTIRSVSFDAIDDVSYLHRLSVGCHEISYSRIYVNATKFVIVSYSVTYNKHREYTNKKVYDLFVHFVQPRLVLEKAETRRHREARSFLHG